MNKTEIVAPGVCRISFGEPENITPFTLKTFPIQPLPFDETEQDSSSTALCQAIDCKLSARGCMIELPLDKDERVFGFGLQLNSLEQTNRKKTLRINSDPIADTGDSHAPVPFYLSTKGYGVLVDTARYATFYCGSHTPTSEPPPVMKDDGGVIADSAEALYRRARVPRGPMLVEVPSAKGVNLYIFSGPTMLDALRRYVLFSGGGCLPPMWGLGNWYRTYVRHHQDEVLALAKNLRESNIPIDVLGLEPGWHAHAYACNYHWHPDRFPEPEKLISTVNAEGFKLNLWEHVFVDSTADFYQDLLPRSGDYRVWGGLVPDLVDDRARDVFKEHHQSHFIARGISGFKLDECDNSDFIAYPWSFPEVSSFPSGADGEQMHSVFGIQYQRLIDEVFRSQDRRTYGQVRSSHAFASPYPFVLYSDLYEHRDFLRGVCTAPLGGLLWSPEVRQCKNVEDLLRRVQSVVLGPQSLVNGWMIRNPPWKQVIKELNNENKFMENWEEVEARCRSIFSWRMRLLPYLYSSFYDYLKNGTPPFRPLVLDFPDDTETYQIDDAWMIGENLYVCPVVEGCRERNVYFPKVQGGWFDLHTGRHFEPGEKIVLQAPLDRTLIFVRSGSVLPLAEPIPFVAKDTIFNIDVYTFGESMRPTYLIEDDFETYGYEKCQLNHLKLTASLNDNNELIGHCERHGSYNQERYRIMSWNRADGAGIKGFTC